MANKLELQNDFRNRTERLTLELWICFQMVFHYAVKYISVLDLMSSCQLHKSALFSVFWPVINIGSEIRNKSVSSSLLEVYQKTPSLTCVLSTLYTAKRGFYLKFYLFFKGPNSVNCISLKKDLCVKGCLILGPFYSVFLWGFSKGWCL